MEGPMMWSLAATTALDMGSNKQVASKLNGEAYLSMHFAMQFVTLMTSKKKKNPMVFMVRQVMKIFSLTLMKRTRLLAL